MITIENENAVLAGLHSQDLDLNDISNGKVTRTKKIDKRQEAKSPFVTYKYSRMGKGDLHEAVIINGKPFFVTYNHKSKEIELKEEIEENNRILIPPSIGEYPYTPYEFESIDELKEFIEKAKITNLDELYIKCKSIFSKYNAQDSHIITLLSADSIWTHFQDLFPTTHYFEGVGTNDVGKSSAGYTFEYTAYGIVKATAMSGPNYYRLLGTIEPGQCVIIEDEGDNISEDSDKVKIFKAGYEFDGKVPKINMNSKSQEQKWYNAYCYKMILAEKSLSQSKAKGVVDRTLSGYFKPGNPKYSIKNIINNKINKNLKNLALYNELLNFRKSMLCYRMIHYIDLFPELQTGLKNRETELFHPLLHLFYGTEAINEIIPTLEIFVKQRRERRGNSLDAALYPIIKNLVFHEVGLDSKYNTYSELKQKKILIPIEFSKIWNYIVNGGIEGVYDEKKKHQYETLNYNIIYNNTLSTLISEKFGAKLDKKSHGSILTFEIEKLDRFEKVYGDKIVEDVKIEVKLIDSASEDTDLEEIKEFNSYNSILDNTLRDNDGYDGYDGSNMCVSSENTNLKTKDNHDSISTGTNVIDIEKLKSYVEPSIYKDLLWILEKETNLQMREVIIHNATQIKRRFEHSDIFECLVPCPYSGDKWDMLKHPCKNFYKQKKEKEKI